MQSILNRVTVVVTVGVVLALWLPAVLLLLLLVPSAVTDPTVALFATIGSVVVVVVAAVVGRIAALIAVHPLHVTVRRLESVVDGNVGPEASLAAARELAEVVTLVERVLATSRRRERDFSIAVGALAHDVRTSLAAVSTVLDAPVAASVGTSTPPTEADGIALDKGTAVALRAELSRVRDLTGDLVVLMRAPDSSPERTTFDISALAKSVVDVLRPRFAVSIDVVVTKPFLRDGVPLLVERVLRNVVENAAKAARSRVVVEVLEGLVVVNDDGPGFMGSDRIRSASPGVAGDQGSHLEHGFGFEIACRLAELVGGRVRVQPTGMTGTTVLVYL